MTELVSSSAIRVGAVRGRYFRENFAQGGIDLVQIVPEIRARRLAEERPADLRELRVRCSRPPAGARA